MNNDLFLGYLRDQDLAEGRACIEAHAAGLVDYGALGILIRYEAHRQLFIDLRVALKLGELLVFLGERVQYASARALGLMVKGEALMMMGYYQASVEYLDSAGEEFLRLGDEVHWAQSRVGWIWSCGWLGRVEEALQGAARAREVLLHHGEYYWACLADINTAMIYRQIGHYQQAIDLYDRILAIYPTLSDQSEPDIKRAMAMAENNKARNLSLLGHFEQAYRLFQQAQTRFLALKETSHVIGIEVNLAYLDYALGYYGLALRRYYQARDSLTQSNLDDPRRVIEMLQNMAACLVKLNRVQEACQLAAEAVAICRRLDTSLDTGDALREYATTLGASGRLQEALQALDEAALLFSQGGFDHHASDTRLQQAELLFEMGDSTAAYEQARLVKQFFDMQGLVSRSVRASLLMASALIEGVRQTEGAQEEALLLCKQAVLQARQHNLQEEVYKNHHLLGRLAALRGKLGQAGWHYSAAIAQIERILNNLVYDLSPAFLHTAWAVYEDMIALCLQQAQLERAFSYLERARSTALRQHLNKSHARERPDGVVPVSVLRTQHELQLKEWQARYRAYSAQLLSPDPSLLADIDQEMIRAELKRCEAKLSEWFERLHLSELDGHASRSKKIRHKTRSRQLLDMAQLRQQLEPNQTLLAYFLYQGRLVIFALTAERLITYEHPDGVARLERLLPLFYAHLEPRGWPDLHKPPQQAIRRLLHKLYELLVAPVAALLPAPSGYLTIVPYGPLHKFPFHALHDGTHFLVEDFQINYLPASSLLTHLSTRRDESSVRSVDAEVATRPPLVFGYSQDGHLQRALDEAKLLARWLGGNCYLEEEATIARLIQEAPGSPIIHLATHGHSRLDTPNFSSVRLADGQFNAIDAFSLDLQGCELVTLSGCETGLAFSGGGDEQLGLGRAFLAAGASSLVMSLWPVEDNATNELMQLFYQRLLQGESRVQALRAAQCSLLQQTSHPYFWAAFRLVGDVGPLNRAIVKNLASVPEDCAPKKYVSSVS